jgi:hypothetical protein
MSREKPDALTYNGTTFSDGWQLCFSIATGADRTDLASFVNKSNHPMRPHLFRRENGTYVEKDLSDLRPDVSFASYMDTVFSEHDIYLEFTLKYLDCTSPRHLVEGPVTVRKLIREIKGWYARDLDAPDLLGGESSGMKVFVENLVPIETWNVALYPTYRTLWKTFRTYADLQYHFHLCVGLRKVGHNTWQPLFEY